MLGKHGFQAREIFPQGGKHEPYILERKKHQNRYQINENIDSYLGKNGLRSHPLFLL
jgi:hypothetical protein